jgi:hypothetical protein
VILLLQGDASFLLEEFKDAKAAYERGMELEPESIELKVGGVFLLLCSMWYRDGNEIGILWV